MVANVLPDWLFTHRLFIRSLVADTATLFSEGEDRTDAMRLLLLLGRQAAGACRRSRQSRLEKQYHVSRERYVIVWNRMDASDFPDPAIDETASAAKQTAVVAGGCFWCTEAVFLQIEGVEKVVSGYSGGEASTANYDAVCGGRTGHAEAIEITYDPAKISYGRLLKIFFSVAHDPTQ